MTRRYVPLLLTLTALWGASYLFIKVGVRDLAPTVLVELRLLLAAASLSLVPFAAFQLPSRFPSPGVTAAVLALSIGGTGFAYVLYYALLAGAGASRSILVTYLVPALALGYGAIFLGEPVTVAAVAGLALVLAGVGLGTGALRLPRRRETRLASDL